jgi:hypothetical protein
MPIDIKSRSSLSNLKRSASMHADNESVIEMLTPMPKSASVPLSLVDALLVVDVSVPSTYRLCKGLSRLGDGVL